jgi:hypothetical protein
MQIRAFQPHEEVAKGFLRLVNGIGKSFGASLIEFPG